MSDSQSCTIAVHNLVAGTQSCHVTPQSVEEAMKNHGEVTLARDFQLREAFEEEKDSPLAVAIFRDNAENRIKIIWHPIGSDVAAAECFRELIAKGGAL